MTLTRSGLALALMLALGACTNGFGGFGDNRPGAPAGGSGTANPASVAYFNETVGDRVLFAVDQSSLNEEARATLASQAAWLMQNGEFTALIEGHADEQGTREYNLALGARRANAVRDFLVERGVAENRLRTITYGKERPLEICSTEACWRLNRRAVTVVAAGGRS